MLLPAPDESLWVGVLRLVLAVPGSRSLKDKRRAVHQVRDRLRARRNVSVAEVGHLEHHGRAVLAVSMVANDARHLRSALDGIRQEIGDWHVGVVEESDVQVLRPWQGDAPAWDDEDYDGDDA